MAEVTARIKIKNVHYEIKVNLDEALKIREGKSNNIMGALVSPTIFYDLKKGERASEKDLTDAFGTSDLYKVATHIIQKGEVQKTQEFRDEQKEQRIKQIIALVLRNAVDQNGRPYTEERLRRAISEVHFNFDNRPAEQQMSELIHELKKVIPIKVELKKVKLTVPAAYTGQVYGLLKDYKESEEWLSNGTLQATLNIPAGLIIDFYDKLNHVTHGAAHAEEIQQ